MAEIKKLYNISLTGEKELATKMEAVNRSFDAAKKNFLELKTTLSQGNLSTDEMKNLKTSMELARLETIKLNQERIRLTNDGRALSNALKQERADRAANNQSLAQNTNEYKELAKSLNIARNDAKALGAEFGIESEVFIQAARKANALDKEIKSIDAAVGQFQRNVGNYPKEINIGKISTGAIDSLKNAGLGNLLGNQIDQTKGKVVQLNSEFARMKSELDQAKAAGVTDMNALESEIIQNRIEADKLNAEIKSSQTHLAGMGSVGNGVFTDFKSNISQVILGYVGLQAAMSTVTELVKGSKELSDQTTNLEIELNKTAGGASKLVDQLAQLDTRTKLTVLEEMANIAAKAGVSEENLVGVTQAIDKIKIAFGKDFGDVEQGTESLVKIINIFEGADQVNGENLLKTGNALRTLANESVASVPFITDFTKRMAGLKGISDVSLPSVLGLASGFEQFGQTSEVSSTALVKIIPKIAKDVDKFAKIAGVTNAEFKKMINENPAEALIKVSEGLIKNKNGITDISKSFADSELGSGRIASVLAVLGKNADTFRKSIDSAGKAYQNTGNIEDAFKAKNENLAGTMEKVSKSIADVANNQTFQNFILGASNAIITFTKLILAIPFSFFITAITLLSAGWLYYKGQAIQAGLATAWNSEQTALGTIRLAAQRLGLISTTIATETQTLAIEEATVAQVGLNTAMSANPLGLILSLLALAIPFLLSFKSANDNVTDSLKKENETLKTTKVLQQEMAKSMQEQVGKVKASVDQLIRIIKDEKSSLEVRKAAYDELIKISPEFVGTLDAEYKATGRLAEVYNKYIENLKKVAKAKALQNIIDKAVEVDTKANQKLYEATIAADNEKLKNKEIEKRNKKVSKDEIYVGTGSGSAAGSGGAVSYSASYEALNTKAAKTLEEAINIKKDAEKNLKTAQDFLNSQDDKTKIGAITKTNSSTHIDVPDDKASKLTGGQKDYLRDINALREANLSELKKQRLEGLITEEDFLKKSLAVNIKYNDQILAHFKGTDAITRKLRADTASDTIDKRIETNAKLFKIQEEEIKQTLENQKSIAQAKLDNVTNDPGASSLDKVEAEKVFYEEILKAQVDFNTQMSALENNLKIESNKNAEDRKNILIKNQTDLNNKIAQLSKVQFESLLNIPKDLETHKKNQAEIESSIERTRILNDKNLTQKEKEVLIQNENLKLANAIANIELGSINAQVQEYEIRKKAQELTVEEVRAYEELLVKQANAVEKKATTENDVMTKGGGELPIPTSDGLQKKLTSKLSQSFGLNEKESALLGEAIAQSFDLASQAMSSYFESEKQAVEQSKQLAYQRIDLEKKQLLAKAQSTADREAIEKQAQIKKDKADKEAHEKMKKIKKQEITIAFALQLANLAVAAAAAGAAAGPAAPIVIPILYGVMAAVATAGYLMNMANVNKQQFARGGAIPTKGGQFVGNSHADGGIPVGINEFEGDELAIINKNSAQSNKVYTVTGTPKQIASGINEIGGGVSFSSGAIFKKYATGGYSGSSVQPPVFRSYYENRTSQISNSNNGNSERLDRIEQMLEHTNTTLSREVHRKTFVSSRDMSSIQKNDDKQSQIGTL